MTKLLQQQQPNSVNTYQALRALMLHHLMITDPWTYKDGDTVLVKIPYGHYSTLFKKGTLTGVYNTGHWLNS